MSSPRRSRPPIDEKGKGKMILSPQKYAFTDRLLQNMDKILFRYVDLNHSHPLILSLIMATDSKKLLKNTYLNDMTKKLFEDTKFILRKPLEDIIMKITPDILQQTLDLIKESDRLDMEFETMRSIRRDYGLPPANMSKREFNKINHQMDKEIFLNLKKEYEDNKKALIEQFNLIPTIKQLLDYSRHMKGLKKDNSIEILKELFVNL